MPPQKWGGQGRRPSRRAWLTAWIRLCTPSLRIALFTYDLTVFGSSPVAAAISSLVSPRSTCASISASRGDRLAPRRREAGGAGAPHAARLDPGGAAVHAPGQGRDLSRRTFPV